MVASGRSRGRGSDSGHFIGLGLVNEGAMGLRRRFRKQRRRVMCINHLSARAVVLILLSEKLFK